MTDTHHTATGAHLPRRRLLGGAVLGAALLLQGCATTSSTAVSRETAFAPNEGVVTLRLVNLGHMPIYWISVKAEGSDQTYTLRGVHFGQTSTMTVVGRLPAGRYQPAEMFASAYQTQLRSPLAQLTGKFDVEAARVTDLGTMIYVPQPDVAPTTPAEVALRAQLPGTTTVRRFSLPLDPTPVPSEKLLAARFPALAAAVSGRSSLGWVAGTVPAQSAERLKQARLSVDEVSTPVFLGAGRSLSGGPLGMVADRTGNSAPLMRSSGSVHQIEQVLVLKDGRWLVGGEEGYVAVSDSAGLRWQRVAGLGPDELVIHLSQAPDGQLHLVTMHDAGTTVYASAANPVQWKELRRINGERELGRTLFGTVLRDSAVSTQERLVVHTRPETLSTLDYRSGQWETQKTPRAFQGGMKATPDGYVVGVFSAGWMYGSLDYGKSWNKLESWVNMSMPEFIDRNRGFMVAAEVGLTGLSEFKLRRTEDGGKTWTTGGRAAGQWQWLQPLWSEADGKTLYTLKWGQLNSSVDQGRTWR